MVNHLEVSIHGFWEPRRIGRCGGFPFPRKASQVGPQGPQPPYVPSDKTKGPIGLEKDYEDQWKEFMSALDWAQGGLKGDIKDLDFYKGGIGSLTSLLNNQGNDLSGLQNQWGNIAQGNDPLLARMRQEEVGRTNAALAQQGITGSVAMNQATRAGQGFDAMNLARRDQALMAQQGIIGQRSALTGQQQGIYESQAGITEQQSDTRSSVAGNAALPLGLDIAYTGAQNMGKGGGGGGGLFGKVICCLLYERGDLSEREWRADERFGQSVGHIVMRGYHAWAIPLARFLRAHLWAYRMVRPLAKAWACHMAGGESKVGATLNWFGLRFCRWLGKRLNRLSPVVA